VALRAVNISMYKLIITSGCSFSENTDTWVCELERYYRAVNPACEFQHLAVASQGNELIQKKATWAVLSALNRYRPEDIALFVMWSTHDRRAFYLPEYTRDLMRIPVFNNKPIPPQFTDLSGLEQPGSGWVHCHSSTTGENPVSDFYYSHIHSLELGVHVTLENMLTLNLLLNQKGVWSRQMMIMSRVYDHIITHSQHNLCEHLCAAMDWSSVDLVGELDWLRGQPHSDQYFRADGQHPNRRGHELWFQQRLLPRISGLGG
jgi:hypothetical protein